MAMASSDHNELHFILIPLMAQGHMIPMTDIARLLAQHGVAVTIITTPINAFRFKTIIDRAVKSGLRIQLLQLHFPSKEAGLPEGCENYDHISSQEMKINFFKATSMLQPALEQSLGEMEPRPSCIISDMALPWTSHTALKFGIPRIFFNGMSCFTLLCNQNLLRYRPHDSVESDSQTFLVPGMPHVIELTKGQLLGLVRDDKSYLQELRKQMREVELTSDGVLINSFYELEPSYVDQYQKLMGKKAWCVGPVSLYNKEASDKADRGNKAAIDEDKCLEWLDSKETDSVIYVCLGSLCPLAPSQLIEIGMALQRSNRPFIWVIRQGNNNKPSPDQLERWLSEERFEERTKGRGLLIRGWAPQVMILSHTAVGGFITHCGWNSTLEGMSAGVPMITWPMFADQFYNEKLIVQILEIGVRVGVDIPCPVVEGERVGVYVKGEEVEKAIGLLMDGGEEGEVRRKKVRTLREVAKRAVEEGGSSHLNISLFIQDIICQVAQKHSRTVKESSLLVMDKL
ncbi:UDP-glycosyltransferase 73C25-like [Macadamia integrifolia]|uniref:UDP-glycosyltransferase 73C25-like n=1 Tax=Macadamia integrifolia TaxID=60698 RepID=UPI001C4FD501|nr:UDP-glycosyltransferase 73C25-like [Macadamia integrifolia]